jgi:zona occludens toxin (predicted ATPase)
MEKLHNYQGFQGRFHEWRDDLKAKFANWREDHEGESLVDLANSSVRKAASNEPGGVVKEDYSHIYRSVMPALSSNRHRFRFPLTLKKDKKK